MNITGGMCLKDQYLEAQDPKLPQAYRNTYLQRQQEQYSDYVLRKSICVLAWVSYKSDDIITLLSMIKGIKETRRGAL